MTGVDGVFHIAGWYKIGVRDRPAAVGVNIDGTRNVLELMAELGVAQGVYTSTLAVNSDTHGQIVDESYRFAGRHVSLYDETKAEAHRIAEAFIARGLPLVIVQPGAVYGPGDTSAIRASFLQFLHRKLPAVPKRTAYSWGHIEDTARGHVLAMARGAARPQLLHLRAVAHARARHRSRVRDHGDPGAAPSPAPRRHARRRPFDRTHRADPAGAAVVHG